jgi:hypothetical protein
MKKCRLVVCALLFLNGCSESTTPEACINDSDCQANQKCIGGKCQLAGSCDGIVCNQPPADRCLDAQLLRQYEDSGECSDGECNYGYEDVICEEGCQNDDCLGCTPDWNDTSECDCTPDECNDCDGRKNQADGCGNTRQVDCTLTASGCGTLCCAGVCCPADQICYNDDCCASDCAGKVCGPDGCGSSCGNCDPDQECVAGQCIADCGDCLPGETCVSGRCAPIAILLARPSLDDSSLWCPPGYSQAGRWQTGPGNFGAAVEGVDFHKYKISAGWMWLCSADPDRVQVIVGSDECNSQTAVCQGLERGIWHVGAGCSGSGTHGVGRDGTSIEQGWMRLCVANGIAAKVETGSNDCGDNGPGCGSFNGMGSWHTDPAECDSGDNGVGDSGVAIGTGWMRLCVDSDKFPPVDTSSLTGKVVTGYQGWFATPGDGSQRNSWVHWFRSQTPSAANATFDLWPDLSEYSAAELVASDMQYTSGGPAGLYSAYRQATVERHLRWMAEYGIDAAFLQRFLSEVGGGAGLEFRDQVTRNVISGAEKYGRAFVIMYDISGANAASLVDDLIDDWKHLVDDPSLQVTSSPSYLQHNGRPLVAIWGFGFNDRPGSTTDAQAVLDFFKNAVEPRYRATVMGGVPTNWRTSTGDSQPGFGDVYRAFDIISPWSVGRYGTEAEVINFNQNYIQPDLVEAANVGKEYMPVIFPGFSWANLRQDPGLFNAIPRNGGSFFHKQIYQARNSGSQMLYIAMFDEVDESTAIFKAAASQSELPSSGQFLALDQDGISVPNDWYLRLAGVAMKMIVGQIPLADELPLQ